jgi:hypothetical protein
MGGGGGGGEMEFDGQFALFQAAVECPASLQVHHICTIYVIDFPS